MKPAVTVARRGAVLSLAVALCVAMWAHQVSLIGYLSWALVLFPAGVFCTLATWTMAKRLGSNILASLVLMATSFGSGLFAVYFEAAVVHLLSPKFLPDPWAPSNLVPGVYLGGLIGFWEFIGRRPNQRLERP